MLFLKEWHHCRTPVMSEARPLISVVTVSYNQGRFIGDAIRSVLAQGWHSVEHLVVDAMSNDETCDVLACYPHVKVIREPDAGQSDGLNKGFRAARGDYILWLNSDDYLLPDAFNTFWRYRQRHPDAGAFFGHFYQVDAAGHFIRALRVPPFNAGVNRHYGVCCPTSGAFYARRLFRQLNIQLDLNLHIVMDWDFYQQLYEHNVEMVRVPAFLSAFRVHEENKSIGDKDPNKKRRAKLDQRRFAERQMFARRYGWRLGLGTGLDELARKALMHVFHARYIASKAWRLYYLNNQIDRLLCPPNTLPPAPLTD